MEIRGKFATAVSYAKEIEPAAEEQIRTMCDQEFTEGCRVRIMPDVHAGKGCTIGTTMTIRGKAVPNPHQFLPDAGGDHEGAPFR